jgi:hypothetical protein
MWEKKEDPLWKNYEIAVWVSTIITILFFWVKTLGYGFSWSTILFLVVMTMSLGYIIFYIFIFIFGLIALLHERIRKK